ncbi:unnamed protein product [Ophioblennius macclurei]
MMPADAAMTSLVQRIARQALLTFRCPSGGKRFSEQHATLQSLMTQVRAADLRLVPRRAEDGGGARPCRQQQQVHVAAAAAPVTYMHICETEAFSMGVFLLRGGARIPLHDHPGMHGVLKVLYGKLRISCFDRPERGPGAGAGPCRSLLRSSGVYTEDSPPCVLSPERDNLHQIDAVDGPSAFMDILAPPYDPDRGRDCHYYRLLSGPGAAGGAGAGPQDVWLLEVAQPEDFWCGGEPYPGPEVRF